MDTMILVVIAAVVAAVLIGPMVAVGAWIEARNVRASNRLLRSRLEAVSEELGAALWHLQDARGFLVGKGEEVLRAKKALKITDGCFIERGKIIADLNTRVKALETFIEEAYGPLDECEIK